MLSREFNQLIYDYRAIIFLLFCVFIQIISWRMWIRIVKEDLGHLKLRGFLGNALPLLGIIHTVFIIFNLAWFFTVGILYYNGNLGDYYWTFIGRPAVAWQVIYLFAILPLGMFSSFFSKILFKIFKKRLETSNKFDKDRRAFLKGLGGAAGSLAILSTCAYGIIKQSTAPLLVRHNIDIKGLPPQLDGFLIAHITDIHLGLWSSPHELDMALALIAEEKVDLVAFTGDLVDRDAEMAKLYRKPLQRLKNVPYGLWGVLGNHDHYTNKPYMVAQHLRDCGLNILLDEQVNFPSLPLSLIGLDDQGMHSSWLGRGGFSISKMKQDPDVLNFGLISGEKARPGDFTILLNHRPEGFAQAAAHGCRLYLAGHTHGGQYQFPYKDQLNLAAAFYKYSSGLYNGHGAWINVCRGIAAVGVPFRLWAWPQVSLIKLNSV